MRIERLNEYVKLFRVRRNTLAQSIGVDDSTIGKYLSGKLPMGNKRFVEIVEALQALSDSEVQRYLLRTWVAGNLEEEHRTALLKIGNLEEKISQASKMLK